MVNRKPNGPYAKPPRGGSGSSLIPGNRVSAKEFQERLSGMLQNSVTAGRSMRPQRADRRPAPASIMASTENEDATRSRSAGRYRVAHRGRSRLGRWRCASAAASTGGTKLRRRPGHRFPGCRRHWCDHRHAGGGGFQDDVGQGFRAAGDHQSAEREASPRAPAWPARSAPRDQDRCARPGSAARRDRTVADDGRGH